MTSPGPQASTVGAAASLQIQAADSSGAALAYSATGLPAGLPICSSTGLISGTPTAAGTYSVTVGHRHRYRRRPGPPRSPGRSARPPATIANAWNGTATQSGENVTITTVGHNGAIPAGGSTPPGFRGTWNTSDAAPTAFALNGAACTT